MEDGPPPYKAAKDGVLMWTTISAHMKSGANLSGAKAGPETQVEKVFPLSYSDLSY